MDRADRFDHLLDCKRWFASVRGCFKKMIDFLLLQFICRLFDYFVITVSIYSVDYYLLWRLEITVTFFLNLYNTLDVSSPKNEVTTSKVSISKSEKSNRLADQDKKRLLFCFILFVDTSTYFIYKAIDKYSLKIKLLFSRQLLFFAGKLNRSSDQDHTVAAYLSRLAITQVVRTVPNVLCSKL